MTRVGAVAKPAAKKRAAGTRAAGKTADPTGRHCNEVTVRGRLAAAGVSKQLPSGDEIVTWRLVVERAAATGTRKVDVIDCTAFGARVRRQALGWGEGDLIEVAGALRRRFWRGAGGLQSRCEVEVDSATRRASAAGRAAVAAALSRPRRTG